MVELKGVSKSYNKSEKRAVDNIDLIVKKGEIFGFLGPNGAGKTTTIKMITGILSPDTGYVTVNGFDITNSPIEAKSSIGYVPDNHDVYDRLSAIEYLNFIADVYKVSAEDRAYRIKKYMEMFEIADASKDLIKSFSHGMRQKLVITAALLHNPPLWLLDEPMTGLDPKSAHLLKEQMKEHTKAGNTVFFSTHVLEVAEKLCDRIAIINHGKIIFTGTMDELDSGDKRQSLEKLFLELTEL